MKGIVDAINQDKFGYLFGVALADDDGQTYRFDQRNLKFNESLQSYRVGDSIEFNVYTTAEGLIYATNVINLTLSQSRSARSVVPRVEEVEPAVPISARWYQYGLAKKVDLSNLSQEEESIVLKLAKCLYVSNAGCFSPQQKGSIYKYALLGPTKKFAMQFGLDKVEFSVIFSEKKDFQRRILEEGFSFLTSTVIPKIRIAGHFYLLFSNYDEIVNELRKPDVQSVMQYSVVPFSYSEALAWSQDSAQIEEHLIKRFKEFLFERNFFEYSEPIKDRLFLFGGREKIANDLVDRAISGNHSGIFGIRKSGKTSVINAIKAELDSRFYLYVSYRCSDFFADEWYEALYRIVKDLYKKFGFANDIPHSSYDSKNANDFFENDLSELLEVVEKSAILIFDEIELMTFTSCPSEIAWSKPLSFYLFWNTIVTFCEKHSNQLALIIAGINPLISEDKALNESASMWNPMYQKLSNGSYLPMFNEYQVERMVNTLGKYMGVDFDKGVCQRLTADFGGHPYLIRQMCRLICEHIANKNLRDELKETNVFEVSMPLYDEIKRADKFAGESNKWCADTLKELRIYYPNEYKILVELAHDDSRTISLIKKSDLELQHLIGYGLVELDKLSKAARIKVEIIKNYLLNNSDYEKPYDEMTNDEIDTEISGGIGEIEQPLRRLIIDVLSSVMSESDGKRFILTTSRYCRDNARTNFSNATLQDMLNPAFCTIHFSALQEIICAQNNFETFKYKFAPYSKGEIIAFLSNINVARNSADHHYVVKNAATLNNFRNSLKEIKKILRKYNYIS